MWVMSKVGFFSIVKHRSSADTWLVRSRSRRDLENLMDATGVATDIDDESGTDYPFRIFVTGLGLHTLMCVFRDTIDYPNFKAEVEKTPGQEDKLARYHNVWLDMNPDADHLEDWPVFEGDPPILAFDPGDGHTVELHFEGDEDLELLPVRVDEDEEDDDA